jgi:hypothetical protein
MNTPTIDTIERITGIAGNYAYRVRVTYRDNAGNAISTHRIIFTGSLYGAPVVMITEHGHTFVTDWKRHGDKLNPEWIRRFFS